MMASIKNQTTKTILSFFFLTAGSILAAYALEALLIPNTILDGGVTGISIIVSKITELPLSLLVLLFNIPFIYIGYKNCYSPFV